MISINSLIEHGANVRLELSPTDLKMFAESIVEQTIMAHRRELESVKETEEETYLDTKQVRKLLNVCDGTLNTWAKRGYLVPVKVGMRNMYALSDINRIRTGNRCESVASYCRKEGRK